MRWTVAPNRSIARPRTSSQVTNVNDLGVASRSAVTCWVKLVKYCARRGVTSGAFSPRADGRQDVAQALAEPGIRIGLRGLRPHEQARDVTSGHAVGQPP